MRKINFLKSMTLLMVGAVLTLGSCKKDEDGGDPPIDLKKVGFYINGSATGDEDLIINAKQLVEPSSDFAVKVERDGMVYGIHYLSAGDFKVLEVTDNGESNYGIAVDSTVTQDGETGNPFDFDDCTITKDGTDLYTVSSEGLYYILLDETTQKFEVMKINSMEINVTGDEATQILGNKDAASFEVKGVDLRAPFKVRFNTAWKFVLPGIPWTDLDAGGTADDHCRPVISYGGSADNLTGDGGDISIENGGKLLDFTFNWVSGEAGIAGVTITTTEGEELPPLAFPEHLYMTGAAVGNGAWDWDTNGIELTPVGNTNPHLFYSIQWVEIGTDVGFKFSPELAWGKDFAIDAASGVDGIYDKGADNVTVTEAGYYTIVVNLETEKVEINAPMIHGIGDTFGGWDAAMPASLFTVDNTTKTIYSPALVAAADVRMHVAATILTNKDGDAVQWWAAEFNVIDGNIEYRGAGGDQAAVAGTTGQVVTLDFVAGTGTIQ